MNNDSYKIIISVSHHRIAFEYWQRDGEKKLVPMPNVSCPAPLAFYCSDTGIEIGETGVKAAHASTPNAFDNYFERLTSDETYSFGGQRKPLRYLLLDAAEIVFADFFKNVLLGSKGSLPDNRATMPITLVCEADVKPNERVLLLNLFRDSGYNRFMVAEYNTYIENYFRTSLSGEYGIDKMIVAWTEGSDLTFTLLDLNDKSERRQATYPDLGRDPRLEYVKKLIWERVRGQNPWLTYDLEEESIEKAASDFLNSTVPLVTTTITMSDSMAYHYSLNRTVVDNLQCSEGHMVRTKLEEFIRDCGFSDRKGIMLLLRGVAAGNIYFEQNLCPGFGRTVKTDRRLRGNTMQLILSEVNQHMPAESIKSQDFVKNQPPKFEKPQEKQEEKPGTPANPVDPNKQKALKRDWREVKATVKGKLRNGNQHEAFEIMEEFYATLKEVAGCENLLEEVKVELELIKKEERPIVQKTKEKRQPDSQKPTNPVRQLRPKPEETEIPIGKQLVLDGKLKEARDWYRSHNDVAKAGILTDIIRSKKGVDIRRNTLEECRKSKNKEQINRIIKEIEEFIDLCIKVSMPCDSYKKLLNDYKKI